MKIPHFGKLLSYDIDLTLSLEKLSALMLRRREKSLMSLLTAKGQLLEISSSEIGPGPGRITVELLPDPEFSLPSDDWSLRDEGVYVSEKKLLSLDVAKSFDPTLNASVAEFPGHLFNILRRAPALVPRSFEVKLIALAKALKKPLPEGVEESLLSLIGFETGKNFLPSGDKALSGMILTGRSLKMGRKIRNDWFSRLGSEIRRFLHRTSPISACYLKYALAGKANKVQQDFFAAMSSDLVGVSEPSFQAIAEDEINGGPFFLEGVKIAIQMVYPDVFR
ncbi:MAG: hypothetical protein HQM08_11895 [Candidatus Riflebacteria bacterium]|nr:hypothetical protein [Candidatus Riflebacteria bacterium]